MSRELKPCGTHAAYRRHLSRGEEPCAACRQANRDRARRAKTPSFSRASDSPLDEEEPEDLDQLEELRYLYRRIRVALGSAEPKEVATLVKQGDAILDRISRLDGTAESPKQAEDLLDEFTRQRQERHAAR